MGDFEGTVKVTHASASRKRKATKAARKTAGGPRKIRIAGKTTDPKRRQALVKDLKKLAAKYKFKVTQK